MSGFFIGISEFLHRRPLFFIMTVGLIIFFIAWFSSGIRFSENITSMIPNDERIEKISSVLNHSKFADQLVFNIYADSSAEISSDSLVTFAQRIFAEIAADTSLVREIVFEIDDSRYAEMYDFFYNHLPFYLDSADYERIESLLNPEQMRTTLGKNFKLLISPAGLALKTQLFSDPFHIVPLALERLKNFQFDDNFSIYQSHIFTKDRKHLMAFLVPVNPSGNIPAGKKLISEIDNIIASHANPSINVEYYGGTAVAVANARQITSDIILTVSVAMVLLLLLFIFVYKKKRVVLFIFFTVMLAAGISLAFLVIIEGTISAMALGMCAMVLGILVNYPIHFYSHYRITGDMNGTFRDIAESFIMSAFSTAIGFLCLYLVRSEALNQLGLFAAISIFLNSFIVLTIFAWLLRKYYPATAFTEAPFKAFDRITHYSYEKNRVLIAVVLIASVVFLFLPQKVKFNADLSTLNFMPEKLKTAEKNLLSISTQTLGNLYLITSGKTQDEAIGVSEKYQPLLDSMIDQGLAGRKSSAADLVLSEQKQREKIEEWRRFWDRMDRQKVQENLIAAGKTTFFKGEAFQPFIDLINRDFSLTPQADFESLKSLFLKNYLTENDGKFSAITILKVEPGHKSEILEKLANHTDLVVFDKQVFINRFFDILQEDFNILLTASMALVFIILMIVFGRIELGLVTMVPLLLSWIWTLGFMKIFGIEFNIFNVIISTYIFGLGDDYSIFMAQGSINNYKYGKHELSPYRFSILLAAVTTLFGIGVLFLAKHPALRSIAAVSVIGILSAVVISVTIVPVLFSALVYSEGQRRVEPVTLTSFLVSIFAFLLFLAGSALLTVLIPLMMIVPIGRRRVKYIFHSMLSLFLRFVVYSIFPIRKMIETKGKVDFDRPSVIVSNHQSHLDLSIILMLHPKIIVLTNKWVWNNPFYGFVVRFAEFYPIFKGIDDSLVVRLRKKVDDGYSILVFPEGTRTEDGHINRFHQGAFWLADRLNLEIQPLLLHGANHCMIKREFFLRPGKITLRALGKVRVEPPVDGESYRPQAKALRQVYIRELEKMTHELETPDYFRKRLVSQFLYKGPVLEWYAKIKVRMEKNYTWFNSVIPLDANIVDIGCGYGFLAHILCMVSGKRRILGIDYDGEKISVARHIATSMQNVTFEEADILNYELPAADVFLLLDVLHYFPSDFHQEVIEKCIEKLNHGGFIIIRDADADKVAGLWKTKLREFNSTRFFKFNKTNYDSLSYTSGTKIADVARKHGFTVERAENPSNKTDVIFVLKKRVNEL